MGIFFRCRGNKNSWIHPAALFLGLFVLDAFLVSPFIGWYDSGEMIATTLCLGISHPSGQVLFHLLGKLFLLLPFKTPAFRLGLMSAFCSALASVLFWNLCLKISVSLAPRSRKWEEFFPKLKVWLIILVLAWSLSLPWWRYSLTPLIYALHLLLALLILWAISLEKPAKWLLAFFLAGLATVFRPTQFFSLPFLGLAFILNGWRNSSKPPKTVIFIIGAFFLGRSTFLYLPLRSALHPTMAYADLTSFTTLLKHLFALRFSHYVAVISLSNIQTVLKQMFSHFWTDLTPLGIGLILAGLVLAFVRRKAIPVFLWIALGWGAMEGFFVFTIPFPTFESHQVLLGWVFSGLFAGVGLFCLFEKCYGRNIRRKSFLLNPHIVTFLLVCWLVVQLGSIGHLFERKSERGAQDYAKNLLTIMDSKALYLPTEENEYFPIVGFQQSFDFRKDVEVVEPGSTPSDIAPRIRAALTQGRSLYVTRKWDLPPGWAYSAKGPLLQVASQESLQIEETIPFGEPLAQWGNILLEGVTVNPGVVQPGGMVEITYLWARTNFQGEQVKKASGTSPVVALFIDESGRFWMKDGVFWLHDIHEPFGLSFGRLRKNRMYRETRILFIPSDFPQGKYHLVVGLQKEAPKRLPGMESYQYEFYERGDFQNLEKFIGRGENGALVQFSAGQNGMGKNDFWPVLESQKPVLNGCFAPVADLKIKTVGGR